MYVLAYVKNAEPPTEGFNLSNSPIAAVNGDYEKLIIPGVQPEDMYQYLVDHGYISNDINFLMNNNVYTNGNTYVVYGDMSTYIIPFGGGHNNFYYRTSGMDGYLQDMEREDFIYNNTDEPPTEQEMFILTKYDDNPY